MDMSSSGLERVADRCRDEVPIEQQIVFAATKEVRVAELELQVIQSSKACCERQRLAILDEVAAGTRGYAGHVVVECHPWTEVPGRTQERVVCWRNHEAVAPAERGRESIFSGYRVAQVAAVEPVAHAAAGIRARAVEAKLGGVGKIPDMLGADLADERDVIGTQPAHRACQSGEGHLSPGNIAAQEALNILTRRKIAQLAAETQRRLGNLGIKRRQTREQHFDIVDLQR